jgi:hypothetical protein
VVGQPDGPASKRLDGGAVINREKEYLRCVYGGLMVRPCGIPDNEWNNWLAHRQAVLLREEWEREQQRRARQHMAAHRVARHTVQPTAAPQEQPG